MELVDGNASRRTWCESRDQSRAGSCVGEGSMGKRGGWGGWG